MRLPGFVHRKDKDELYVTRIVEINDRLPFTAEDFDLVGAPVDLARVNAAAMKNFDAWVPEVFGDDAVKQGHGGYRVSSASLGRNLEEDLSIHPEGIKDFGVHDMGDTSEGRRTPIEVVMEFTDHKDEASAAAWLGQLLGLKDLQVIRVVGGDLARMVDEAQAALLGFGVPVFIRAGALVEPVAMMRPATRDREVEVSNLRQIGSERLAYLLNKYAAVFLRYDERKKRWVKTDPPPRIIAALLNLNRWTCRR